MKDFFISHAVQWENGQISQRQVWHMVHQILYQLATAHQPINNRLTDILQDTDEMIHCAASYGDLMAGVYSLLFDSDNALDRRMTAQELYNCAWSTFRQTMRSP